MVRKFNCGRSFSAHIEKKKSKCDYHFQRALTAEESAEIENTVNSVIQQNLPVTESYMPLREAESKFNLAKLPADVTGNMRIISVGEYDDCPCIGLHVANTNAIGIFKIISSSFEEGVLRIRFKID
jgi:alanyl-tRNA synthetase